MKENVLIFPCNGLNSINIYDSLRYNLHFNVYGASGILNHSYYCYPKENIYISEKLYIDNEQFITELNNLIKKWNISFIIPTHDTITKFLMENEKNINATIVSSPYETALIAENKKIMYETLIDCEYLPKIYHKGEIIDYPVFLKPSVGAGGKGTKLVNNREELEIELEKNPDLNICEYLPGEEYTIDCFTNRNGELLFIGPRTRERITNGVSYVSRRVELTDEIKNIAKSLNSKVTFRGTWFFQLKKDKNGALKFMEFSTRTAGTMAFYRQLGVNFALLSLFDFMNYDVDILFNDFNLTLDRGTETLYKLDYQYNTIYLDYDDTLIVNDKVNSDIIKLIYQAHNKNINVVLLSKHLGKLEDSMKKHYLANDIFDEIIIINGDEDKSQYIKTNKAIFIDNYYLERKKVYEKCHIPVFDVDAVSCLLDRSEY